MVHGMRGGVFDTAILRAAAAVHRKTRGLPPRRLFMYPVLKDAMWRLL